MTRIYGNNNVSSFLLPPVFLCPPFPRVLNWDETIRVSTQTEQRIFEVAQQLGYAPAHRHGKGRPGAGLPAENGHCQMFEPDMVLQDPYYLYMKNELEKECFEHGIETTTFSGISGGSFRDRGKAPWTAFLPSAALRRTRSAALNGILPMRCLWIPPRITRNTTRCP